MVVGPLPSLRRGVPIPDMRPWVLGVLRSVRDQALADRQRWPLWLPAGFGTGIAVYFALPIEPASAAAWIAGATGIAAGLVGARSPTTALRIAMALTAAIVLGFTVAKTRSDLVGGPMLARKLGPVGLDARVDTAQIHGKGVRVVLSHLSFDRTHGRAVPRRVRISIRGASDILVPGNWIHVTAVVMPPPGPAAPGAYDFGRAAFFDGIGGVGYAYGAATAIAPRAPPTFAERVTTGVALLRWRISERIRAALPGSTGGIAAALITGDRGSISEDDEAALRDAGLAHVLAIAGLHMALVGLGLFWIVRAILAAFPTIALNHPIKKWAALAALAGTTFYLVISGAATPATRAYIMLATMLAAILFDRPALSMRSVALAATIILLLRPESLIEPGFQMSFAAVVGLVAVAEWEAARTARARRDPPPRFAAVRRYLHGIAVTSFVGSIATAPFAVFHFDRATHYAVLGNLLAMPVMGFVTMPFAALSVIAMPFGIERWPLQVMGLGIEAMLAMGRFVSALPGSVSTVAAAPVSAIVALALGGLWICIWRRGWRWLGLAGVVGGIGVALSSSGPDILVARDATTVAVRGADGILRLVRPASDDYSADQWLKRDGDGRDSDAAVASPRDGVRCDAYGCMARGRDGTLIAVESRIDALEEDCRAATILISAMPAHTGCQGPRIVIDRRDVARAGGFAIWLGREEPRIETVEGERGLRPWSQPEPKTRAQYRRMRPTSLP